MSQTISNDLFDNMLKKSGKEIVITKNSINHTMMRKELDFSEIEQQMNSNAVTQLGQHLPFLLSESDTRPQLLLLNKNITDKAMVSGENNSMLSGIGIDIKKTIINVEDCTTETNTDINVGNRTHTDSIIYNSSPDSNFSCTPVDSLGSCTSESTVGHELAELSEHILGNPSVKGHLVHRLDNLKNSVNKNQNHLDYIEADDTEKFLFDQLSIDKEIEEMMSSSCAFANDSNNPQPITSIKRNSSEDLDFTRKEKKQKILVKPQVREPEVKYDSDLRKCFSILKSNYLKLCQTHNQVIEELNETKKETYQLRTALRQLITEKDRLENDKDRFLLKGAEMKATLDSLLHEITSLRAKLRGNKINCTI